MKAERILLAALGCASILGCGLKGPLELPEQSTNIVIRDPARESEPAETANGQPAKPDEKEEEKKL